MGKYLDKIRLHEHGAPIPTMDTRQAAPAPPIQAGAQIQWQRAGQVQQGLVAFIHVDDTGTGWAFVTIGESWAAVNLKFATLVEEGGQR